MPNIKCVWCGSDYRSFNDNRRHCKKLSCRNSEIEENLSCLSKLISPILRHKIKTDSEIRLPGNDTIGKQVKINANGTINERIKNKEIAFFTVEKQVGRVLKYFRDLLWKGIKGNFIIKTDENGTVDNIITHEIFVMTKNPVIFGNNKIIKPMAEIKNKPIKKEETSNVYN